MLPPPEKKVAEYPYNYLRDYIIHIPGENPGPTSLCGTNCFLLGHRETKERIMIDTGDLSTRNGRFLANLTQYLEDLSYIHARLGGDNGRPEEGVYISKILLTHAHPDHMGGLQDVLKLLESRGQKVRPKIFKHLNGNKWEQ